MFNRCWYRKHLWESYWQKSKWVKEEQGEPRRCCSRGKSRNILEKQSDFFLTRIKVVVPQVTMLGRHLWPTAFSGSLLGLQTGSSMCVLLQTTNSHLSFVSCVLHLIQQWCSSWIAFGLHQDHFHWVVLALFSSINWYQCYSKWIASQQTQLRETLSWATYCSHGGSNSCTCVISFSQSYRQVSNLPAG